jgi:hypothetical protein
MTSLEGWGFTIKLRPHACDSLGELTKNRPICQSKSLADISTDKGKFKLRLSINRLQRVLRRLTLEPEPEEGPVRPERPVGLRGRGR